MQTNPHVALWFRKQKVLILGQGENRHEMEVSDLEIEGFNGFEDPEPVPEEEDGAHLTNDPLRQQDPLACGLAAIKREIASPTPGDIRPEAPRDVKPRLELLRAAATAHDLDNAAQPQGSAALHEFEERLALDASQVVVMTNRSDTDTEVDIDNTEEPVTKTCDDCGVTYIPCPDKRLAHRCKWSFRCSVCSWTGRSQAEMRKHEMDEHESRKPHVCIECNGRFKSRLGLRLHMRMHIKSRSTCACSACGANFDTVGNLSRHQNQCRAFIDDPIHRLALKGDRLKPFLCKLCFTSYRFKRDVQRHVVQAHTMKHEFKCDTCVSSFTTQSSLHRHLHVHRAPRPFVCSVCKARFSEPGKLLKHLNRHLSPDSNDSVVGVSGLEAVLVKRELPYMRKGVIKPDFG